MWPTACAVTSPAASALYVCSQLVGAPLVATQAGGWWASVAASMPVLLLVPSVGR